MDLGKINEGLREVVSNLNEGRGFTNVAFIVPLTGGKRRVIDVVPMPINLNWKEGGYGGDNFKRIVSAAWVEFQKHKGGKFKIVRSTTSHRPWFSGRDEIGVEVILKPPRGWQG